MSERITISLPDGLVNEIDELATERRLSRSAFIREASARYVAEAKAGEAAAKKRKDGDEFVDFLRDLRSQPVLDDRPALEILRELRGTSGEAEE